METCTRFPAKAMNCEAWQNRYFGDALKLSWKDSDSVVPRHGVRGKASSRQCSFALRGRSLASGVSLLFDESRMRVFSSRALGVLMETADTRSTESWPVGRLCCLFEVASYHADPVCHTAGDRKFHVSGSRWVWQGRGIEGGKLSSIILKCIISKETGATYRFAASVCF